MACKGIQCSLVTSPNSSIRSGTTTPELNTKSIWHLALGLLLVIMVYEFVIHCRVSFVLNFKPVAIGANNRCD